MIPSDPAGRERTNMVLDAAMIGTVGGVDGPDRMARIFLWDRPTVSLPRMGMPGLNEAGLSASGVAVVRRPTGGGALIHGSDVSFSVAVRSPRGKSLDLVETGRRLVEPVRAGLTLLGFEAEFRSCDSCGGPNEPDQAGDRAARGQLKGKQPSPLCFLQKTPFDLLVSGRKVAAFALRRTGTVLFIHGSVLVEPPPEVAVQGLARFGLPEALRWSEGGASLASIGPVAGLPAVVSAIAKSNDSALFSPLPPLAGVPVP